MKVLPQALAQTGVRSRRSLVIVAVPLAVLTPNRALRDCFCRKLYWILTETRCARQNKLTR
ncbi:MAG: hypothetical protein AAFQ28_14630, partial [Pseudomonadota bacterium]